MNCESTDFCVFDAWAQILFNAISSCTKNDPSKDEIKNFLLSISVLLQEMDCDTQAIYYTYLICKEYLCKLKKDASEETQKSEKNPWETWGNHTWQLVIVVLFKLSIKTWCDDVSMEALVSNKFFDSLFHLKLFSKKVYCSKELHIDTFVDCLHYLIPIRLNRVQLYTAMNAKLLEATIFAILESNILSQVEYFSEQEHSNVTQCLDSYCRFMCLRKRKHQTEYNDDHDNDRMKVACHKNVVYV